MSYLGNFYAPEITQSAPVQPNPPYDSGRMSLKAILTLLIDHCLPFDTLREMTLLQIVECVDRVNSGELKSWEQKKAELKAALEKKGAKR